MSIQVLFIGFLGLVVLLGMVNYLRGRSVIRYTPREVAGLIAGQDGPLLLDVRTDGERTFHHIKGSLHIPLHQLRARTHELQSHRDKVIVCYCQSGNRSVSAAMILQKRGYRAASLRGGIVDWNFTQRSS